jgi:hypothetical protein
MKDLNAAASAAFTHLAFNPDSEIMRENVKWYANALNNPNAEFVNREPFVRTIRKNHS